MKTLIAIAAMVSTLIGAGVDTVLSKVHTQLESEKASQQRIDSLSDESARLYEEYRSVLRQSEQTRTYNAQMERLIMSQRDEITSLDEQIAGIEQTNAALIPLMHRMIDALEQFVLLDTPFLKDERKQRVAGLKALMDDASVTLAEKYRKIMEAYAAENEYGRTIEAYRAELPKNGGNRTVDFLRIGRTGLYYQSLDGSESGMWDKEKRHWIVLDGDDAGAIKKGLKIARKQAAPDLLILPVNAQEAD